MQSLRGGTRQKALARPGRPPVNLERAEVLLIDDATGLDILSQIFHGFGARRVHRCHNAAEAAALIRSQAIDLVVTEAVLGDGPACEFIKQLRRGAFGQPNRFTAVIILSAHTAAGEVAGARDCGANFFLAKPVSPKTFLERLLWVASERRQYLETERFIGPDRRFHDDGLTASLEGRRRDDAETAGRGESAAA